MVIIISFYNTFCFSFPPIILFKIGTRNKLNKEAIIKIKLIGRVKKTITFPLANNNARIIFSSAIGPSIKAIITGPNGKPVLLKIKPIIPAIRQTITSKAELFKAYAPTKEKQKTARLVQARGSFNNLGNTLNSPKYFN